MSDSEDSAKSVRDEAEVRKEIEDKCLEAFMAFDEEGAGQIESSHFRLVIEKIGVKMSDDMVYKIISDIDPRNTGYIPYNEFKARVVETEVTRIMGSDETELLDAFVAMGGQPDGEGCVDAQKLIATIKNEFQMTIDIEGLIDEVDEDGSGEIEFDEFKALLN